MSGPEIKHNLRKTEFPGCAREALLKIGIFIHEIDERLF